jgi:hypothetical protein
MSSTRKDDADSQPKNIPDHSVELFDPWARRLGVDKPDPLPRVPDLG